MTIATTTNKIIHNCNGALTDFEFTFPILESSDLDIIITAVATGSEQLLALTTDYTVAPSSNDYSNGGTVSTVATWSSDYTITIYRAIPRTQDSDFTEGMPTLYETFEDGLDKLTMIAQEFDESLGRAIKIKKSDEDAELEMPTKSERASKFLACDANGDIISTLGAPEGVIPITGYMETLLDDTTALAASQTLELEKGVNVQAYSAILANFDGFSTSAEIVAGTETAKAIAPDQHKLFFLEVGVEFIGISESASAATNATVLQAAIDSSASTLYLPPGTFEYDTGLIIDRAIKICGAGSTGRNNGTGVSMCRISYTGSDVAITLDGEGVNGTYNMHLSDFSLLGNANATGGILIGTTSTTPVIMSSLKNINIDLFNKASAYGLKLQRCQQTIFENVHSHQNYYGVIVGGIPGGNTTLTFRNCHAISSTSIGWYILSMLGSSLYQCLSESNGDRGLYIYSGNVNSVNFHGWHSESNADRTYITGTGVSIPTYCNFWGGYFSEVVSSKTIELDYATSISFHNVTVPSITNVAVSANTSFCVWETHAPSVVGSDVAGNASGRMNLIVPTYPT